MRLNGETFPEAEEEEAKESENFQPQELVVGYALTSKKKNSFLKPKLEVLARSKGITFVAIDTNRPLLDQGPFDIVLHKMSGKEWCEVIERFALLIMNDDQIVEISPSRIQSRKVCVPKQMVIKNDPMSIPDEVFEAGLKLPIVAKPLVVDGSAKSHELFLAYDRFSLAELEPPLVLQEFVNHGGVLFKIYIVGEAIKVVRRFSLPNVSKCELAKVVGLIPFPRVSSAAASADDADLDPGIAELPPRPLLERLARELRLRLGLRLFNIDMIRDYGTRDVFYVIDINYFPGYGKMPDYEHIFTDFLVSLVQSKYMKRPNT
ncbi:inositol-tetrakisphosphate 1-kinase 3-like isoform X3 [Mangifera indica]|uniref:inositol-tetrakisphosphate 1-kinase 3-like isoform X3 n=1 Tax=Mangifera indica TaxID=29780 RepID=UPI001CFBD2DC|nr:inositol-tetrakisphosphate 1-kinase 3-like isoform X3 [Mangifera indica]